MMQCLPTSICSWDYVIRGAPAEGAEVRLDSFLADGSIRLGGVEYGVRQNGWMGGQWTLHTGGLAVASAEKPNYFLRTFELIHGPAHLRLEAEGAFDPGFVLKNQGIVVGRIRKEHLFTRRATIDCVPIVPPTVQLFAFWLAAMSWRRSSRRRRRGMR